MITYEKLGTARPPICWLSKLSANDILGHKVGPDSPEMQAMALAMDRQLGDFFEFLGHQMGLANVWIALSADHGVAPVPAVAAKLRLPAASISVDKMRTQVNSALSSRFARTAEYVREIDYPLAWLNSDSFAAAKVKEEDGERAVGEALKQAGMRGYYTRSQLERGDAPNTETGLKYLHSYSPLGGWYVLGVPVPYTVGVSSGTDHASPYTYDTHVPLAFYGLPFQPGTYRSHAEPVDLAATLASLLGIERSFARHRSCSDRSFAGVPSRLDLLSWVGAGRAERPIGGRPRLSARRNPRFLQGKDIYCPCPGRCCAKA